MPKSKLPAESVDEVQTSALVIELTIPTWNAAIPKDWTLEVKRGPDTPFESVAGRTVILQAGDRLRGGNDLLRRMVEQDFAKEVTTDATHL